MDNRKRNRLAKSVILRATTTSLTVSTQWFAEVRSGSQLVRSGSQWCHGWTTTMTHSKKSHNRRMQAWPCRQECRGHDTTKNNLFY